MSSARSATEVVNMALDHLRMETITSIDDPIETAEVAKRHYQACFDAVLQDHSWSFAKRGEVLAKLTESVPPWRHAYAAPSDLLAPIRVIHPSDYFTTETLPFELRQSANGATRVVACDDEDVMLEYITANTTLAAFSPLALKALVYRLAASLGGALKHNLADVQMADQAYATTIRAAKGKDAESRSYPPLVATAFNAARRRGLPPDVFGGPAPGAVSWGKFNKDAAAREG